MHITKLLPAFAALALSACVTGYGYSDDGYYYARPSASVGTYGGVGYGSGGWRSGYGMSYGYGYPGYYGYSPYAGYYDPYYGYYPRPPIVIIHRPPGDHHGHDHDHDGDDDHGNGNHRPPPWRDLNDLGNRGPIPLRAPDSGDVNPSRGLRPMPRDPDIDTPRGVRPPMPSAPPPPARMRMPDPPPMPSRSDDAPTHKGDRRR